MIAFDIFKLLCMQVCIYIYIYTNICMYILLVIYIYKHMFVYCMRFDMLIVVDAFFLFHTLFMS